MVTRVSRDTVAKVTRVSRDTVARVTRDTVARVTRDIVARVTRVSRDTVARVTRVSRDTVFRVTRVSRDTVVRVTHVSRDTVAMSNPVFPLRGVMCGDQCKCEYDPRGSAGCHCPNKYILILAVLLVGVALSGLYRTHFTLYKPTLFYLTSLHLNLLFFYQNLLSLNLPLNLI